jgi:hypothetical protein
MKSTSAAEEGVNASMETKRNAKRNNKNMSAFKIWLVICSGSTETEWRMMLGTNCRINV